VSFRRSNLIPGKVPVKNGGPLDEGMKVEEDRKFAFSVSFKNRLPCLESEITAPEKKWSAHRKVRIYLAFI